MNENLEPHKKDKGFKLLPESVQTLCKILIKSHHFFLYPHPFKISTTTMIQYPCQHKIKHPMSDSIFVLLNFLIPLI